MKVLFTLRFKHLLLTLLLLPFLPNSTLAQTAGTASSAQDTICEGSNVTLYLNNYTGSIQWQRFNGLAWINESGPGAQNDTFTVSLTASAEFRAFVTSTGQPDDSSNVVSVGVITVNPPNATGAARCGIGPVTLTASGVGTIRWYDAATGGNLLATGNNYQPIVNSSTTFYAEDNINGGSGQTSPLMITEIEIQNNDRLELQNVSAAPLDVTGWKVVVSDSYTAINAVNSIVQTLSGTLPPGGFLEFSDVTTIPVYWGNNLFWNAGAYPGFTGWVMLLDPGNAVMDVVFMNWPSTEIANFNPLVQGIPINIGNQWSGGGVNITNTLGALSIQRIGNSDNNDSLDWVDAGISFQATNPGLVLPMIGFGCSGSRTAVNVTVTPADSISINPGSAAICQGANISLSASSANSNYVYSWTPAQGLNTASGQNVLASPSVTTTYVLNADDGNCAATDTILIEVNSPNDAGIIVSSSDTLCAGTLAYVNTLSFNGQLQWQQNIGSGFTNITGLGSGNPLLTINPLQPTQYRLVANSPGCPPDTSNLISVNTINPANPVVSDTSVCGAGPITLTASANGNLAWFLNPIGGSALGSGSSLSTNVFVTTTYYVENRTGGNLLRVGPANSGFSTPISDIPLDQGILFSAFDDCTIETIYVYPDSAGLLTINLRQSAGGPILCSYSQSVTPGGKTPIPINFSVAPGNNYRLEVASGSVRLKRNTGGATYPYSNAILSLVASLAPSQTTAGYYYLYDWEISTGCRTPRIPLTVTVNSIPPAPVISVNGTLLTSSASSGNQWFLNGNMIPGATSQSYVVTQNGNYFVSVTINGCSSYSDTIFATSIKENFYPVSNWMVYPNPNNGDHLTLDATLTEKANIQINISDASGRRVFSRMLGQRAGDVRERINLPELSNGIYLIELSADGILRNKKLSVIK